MPYVMRVQWADYIAAAFTRRKLSLFRHGDKPETHHLMFTPGQRSMLVRDVVLSDRTMAPDILPRVWPFTIVLIMTSQHTGNLNVQLTLTRTSGATLKRPFQSHCSYLQSRLLHHAPCTSAVCPVGVLSAGVDPVRGWQRQQGQGQELYRFVQTLGLSFVRRQFVSLPDPRLQLGHIVSLCEYRFARPVAR